MNQFENTGGVALLIEIGCGKKNFQGLQILIMNYRF